MYQPSGDHREIFKNAFRAYKTFATLDDLVTRSLQVPPSYAGIWRIIDRIKELLPYWRTLDADWDFPDLVEEWAIKVEAIPDRDPFRSLSILDRRTRRSTRDGGNHYDSQFFTGILISHPVWASIWYRYQGSSAGDDSVSLSRSYDRLVSTFVLSYARLITRGGKPSGETRAYEASSILFKLHGREHRAAFNDWVANGGGEIRKQYDYFRRQHSDQRSDLRQGFGAIADLINEGFELGKVSVFRPRTVEHRGRAPVRPGLDNLNDERHDFWVLQQEPEGAGSGDFSPMPKELMGPGKRVEKKILDSGANPLEFADQYAVWIPAEDLLDPPDVQTGAASELPPLGALYAAARGRQRAEIMASQLFRTRLNRTRPMELARIINKLNALYSRPPENARFNYGQIQETLRFISILIATGAEPIAVCNLHCYEFAEKLPEEWALAYSPKYKVWLHPYLPPERQPLAFRYQEKNIKTWPRIARSDIWSIGQSLGYPIDGCWFANNLRFYEDAFKTVIAPEFAKLGLENYTCTMKQIRDIVYAWFLGMDEGDQLRVAVLFDRNAATAETQHFYTAFNRASLDVLYVEKMGELWRQMTRNGLEASSGLLRLGSAAEVPKTLSGDDYVPRMKSIADLVSALKKRFSKEEIPREGSLERHNLATAYVALGLAIVSGFRSVRTPIPDLKMIDPSTGFMPLQEKDRTDDAHARIVWIPERVRKQVNLYLVHLSGMSSKIWYRQHTGFTVEATKQRDKSRFNSDSYELSLLRTLFFVSEGKGGHIRPIELTGDALKKMLNKIVPDNWPIGNANRHLLRTYLVEAGCPTVLINTLFGHWHVGEASWGPDSTIDPYQYRKAIAPYLDRLLDDIGYESIQL